MEIGKLDKLQVLDVIENNLTYLPFTLTLLYKDSTFAALWLAYNQPPLPKLTVTHEPAMNIKVLTCYLLPQKGEQPITDRKAPSNKSCIGGTRVSFGQDGVKSPDAVVADEGEEHHASFGNFTRYDTPHPKPHAPKNRVSRNSGDFTNIVGQMANNNAADALEQAVPPPVVEARPLRSVLKRRPQSVISQVSAHELGGAQSQNENDGGSQFATVGF
jgi:hypothetical protein